MSVRKWIKIVELAKLGQHEWARLEILLNFEMNIIKERKFAHVFSFKKGAY